MFDNIIWGIVGKKAAQYAVKGAVAALAGVAVVGQTYGIHLSIDQAALDLAVTGAVTGGLAALWNMIKHVKKSK